MTNKDIDIDKILDLLENTPTLPLDWSKPIGVSYKFPIDGYVHTYEASVVSRQLDQNNLYYLVRYGHFDLGETNDVYFRVDGQPKEERFNGSIWIINYDPKVFDEIYSEYLEKN